MIKIPLFGVLIFYTICILTSRGSKIRERRSAFHFTSGNTSGHLIDLSMYPDHDCLNHRHLGNNFSSGNRDSLKIIPKEKHGCFILYNEYNCQGARLEFHYVGKERVLKLDPIELNEYEQEKLLNFDFRPSSISSCPPLSNSSVVRANGSNYSLRSADKGFVITHDCSNIWENFAVNDVIVLFLERNPFYLNDSNHYNEPQICIAFFSERGCYGEMIQFIVSEPFTENDRRLLNNSLKLWHVYDRHIPNSVDTDIKSVLNCPLIYKNVFADNVIATKKNDSAFESEVTDAKKETKKSSLADSTTNATDTFTTEILTKTSESYPSETFTTETNLETSESYTFEIPTTNATKDDVSQTLWKHVAIIIGAIFSATILAGITYTVYKKWIAFKFQTLTQQDIDEFKQGLSDNNYNEKDDEGFVNETALRQPYNRLLEIPKERLKICEWSPRKYYTPGGDRKF